MTYISKVRILNTKDLNLDDIYQIKFNGHNLYGLLSKDDLISTYNNSTVKTSKVFFTYNKKTLEGFGFVSADVDSDGNLSDYSFGEDLFIYKLKFQEYDEAKLKLVFKPKNINVHF